LCLCYLTAPSEAKHKYLLRRIAALARNAKTISVAWSVSSDNAQVQSPASAISILPKLNPAAQEIAADMQSISTEN